MRKPSDFSSIEPMASVMQNAEAEHVAQNIMKILAKNGDEFRVLPWEEYKSEYSCSNGWKSCFDKVIDYCKSEDTAKLFSRFWK